MKTLLLFILLSLSLFAEDKASGFRLYEGSFFIIEYPKNFKPSPSKKNESDLINNARFISPDQKVEFYVHAPQWADEDTYSKLDPKKEKLVSEKKEKDKSGYLHKWVNYQAKDGSYSKSFHEVSHPEFNTLRILGIKYSSQEHYNKYKKEYIHFKKSLKQFAD